MPMYQFACRSCGQAFEKRLRMTQAGEIQVCPTCGSQETRKLILAVAIAGTSRETAANVAPAPSNPFS
jgi:putative FmdB family regulatory protein